jgi:hypothetical protein
MQSLCMPAYLLLGVFTLLPYESQTALNHDTFTLAAVNGDHRASITMLMLKLTAKGAFAAACKVLTA